MEPLLSLLGSLGLVLGGYVLSRLAAPLVDRTVPSPPRTLELADTARRALVAGCLLGSFVIHRIAETGAFLATGAPLPVGTSLVGSVASAGVMTVAAVAATSAISLGFGPLVEEHILSGYRSAPLHERRARIAFVALVFGSLLMVESVLYGPVPIHPVWIAGGVIALWFAYLQVAGPAPVSWLGASYVRAPSEDEMGRLRECYERIEYSVPAHVVVVQSPLVPSVLVHGHGRARSLWVQESTFREASDDDVAVALAQAEATNDRFLFERLRIAKALVFAALSVLLYNQSVSPVPYAVWFGIVVIPIAVVVAWSSRRAVSRSDEAVVEQLGSDAVHSTYTRLGADLLYGPRQAVVELPVLGELVGMFAPVPPRARRIKRLADRHAPR